MHLVHCWRFGELVSGLFSRCGKKMYYKVKQPQPEQSSSTLNHKIMSLRPMPKSNMCTQYNTYGYVELNYFFCLSFSNKCSCLISLAIHYFNSELEFQASMKLAKWTTAGQSDCSMPKVYLIWKEPAAAPGIKAWPTSRRVLSVFSARWEDFHTPCSQ